MPRRWIQFQHGKVKGSPVVAPEGKPEFQPANDPKCDLSFIELADGEDAPVDGSKRVSGAWVAPVNEEPTLKQKKRSARAKRDKLLKDSDTEACARYLERIIAHFGISLDPVEYGIKAYRKKLRDIPKQPGFPNDIDWPAL